MAPTLPPELCLLPDSRRAFIENTSGWTLCGCGLLIVYLAPEMLLAYVIGVILLLAGFALRTAANIRTYGPTFAANSRLWWRGVTVLKIVVRSYAAGRRFFNNTP